MKNNIFKLYIFSSLLAMMVFIASCQKVIDIELRDSDKKYVIDGGIYEGVDSAIVRVTKTTSFFDTQLPEAVTNALVKLTMPDESTIQMTHIGNGYYLANGLNVINDASYSLHVNIADKEFSATSHMQLPVPIDSLQFEFQPPIFGGDPGFNVFLNYQDHPGKNYYRILSSVNGKLLNTPDDLLLVDDNLNDGNPIRIPIFTHLYNPGDTVDVELQSMDADTYEFYQTLSSVASSSAGSPFTAAPANPETNIRGGALGAFGAYATSKKRIIIPH